MNAWARLGLRDRRALTLGALVLLPALGFSLVVQPYRRARAELRDRVAEQRGLLARELALVAAAGRLPGELDDAALALASRRHRLLPGRDPLSATAALVDVAGDAARRHSVLLEAIESRAPEAAGGGLVAVRIEVRGRGDLEGMLGWLRALETGTRLLQIDGLTVARADAGAEPDARDTETLLLAAAIRGYVLTGGAP
jgi:type II secretory pathway component PulM